jgi:hypothetical protein
MRAEAALGRNPVVVDHPQRAEAHPGRIVILIERERVAAVQPVQPGIAAFGSFAVNDHMPFFP